MVSSLNPAFCNAWMHVRFSVWGRLRYPVVGSDHVVGVWVVAQVFKQVTGQGRRERFVIAQTTGQGPGSVAGEPSRTYAAPL